MANTTNFGWETPDDTDLVKDGAAAIRTLGSAIDTSLVDLKGGTTGQVLAKASNTDMDFSWVAQDDSNAIQNAIVDAKGDLISATAADTPARLAVGTNGQVLTADSTQSTGLAWTTPSSGGFTLLSTTSLSGVSTTVSSISGSYKNLFVFVKGVYVNTDSAQINIRLNTDSGSNYANNIVRNTAGTLVGISSTESQIRAIARTPNSNSNALYLGNAQLFLPRYTDTDIQPYSLVSMGADAGAGTYQSYHGTGTYNNSAAITSVTVLSNDGTTTFTGGTIYIYGES
jgi:hypothetical protein